MNDDHPLKHPENALPFLRYIGVMFASALGVVWIFKGALLSQLPGLTIVVAVMVAMFAWGPIFHRLFGRLPAQTWAKVPKDKRWSELLFHGAFVVSFMLWGAVLLMITWPLLSEVEP